MIRRVLNAQKGQTVDCFAMRIVPGRTAVKFLG